MKMILRWFGEGHDSVPLSYIRQIPGVSGVAATLMGLPAGALWEAEEIEGMKRIIQSAGLTMEVIESVNVHDDIKLGLPSREGYIENYKKTVHNLGKAGVRVICYNFMPVFDWMRTDLWKPLPDGSCTMAYEHTILEQLGSPEEIIERFEKGSGGFSLPGWEPERLGAVRELFAKYAGITHDDLIEHLRYFLSQIMPACEESGIRMAIHPDDPPWDIFGLPRVFKDRQSARQILSAVNHPCNGLTLCTGSLGVSPENDVSAIIREFGARIPFAHVRNFQRGSGRDFHETSHLTRDGSLDMLEIVRALHDSAPACYIRPDHGRMIWGERGRPGYGLYDRALGAAYLNGLWEALDGER